MKVVCSLTREQASLYKAVVDEEMRRIGQLEGMQRRGSVLALLTHTKQICNHPAHYWGESGPLPRRSGKLTRLAEMLDEVISSGDMENPERHAEPLWDLGPLHCWTYETPIGKLFEAQINVAAESARKRLPPG